MITQNLSVKGISGEVHGGSVALEIDTDGGNISYSGQIKYGPFGMLSYQIPPGNYPVPPADLKSQFFTQAGQTLTFGSVTLTVTSLAPGQATVSIALQGNADDTGTAILDTSGEFILLKSAVIKATVDGFNVTVGVQPS